MNERGMPPGSTELNPEATKERMEALAREVIGMFQATFKSDTGQELNAENMMRYLTEYPAELLDSELVLGELYLTDILSISLPENEEDLDILEPSFNIFGDKLLSVTALPSTEKDDRVYSQAILLAIRVRALAGRIIDKKKLMARKNVVYMPNFAPKESPREEKVWNIILRNITRHAHEMGIDLPETWNINEEEFDEDDELEFSPEDFGTLNDGSPYSVSIRDALNRLFKKYEKPDDFREIVLGKDPTV